MKLFDGSSVFAIAAHMAADMPVSPDKGNGEDMTPPPVAPKKRGKAKKKGELADETTLDRTESLPEEVKPAPTTPPSQDAPSLDTGRRAATWLRKRKRSGSSSPAIGPPDTPRTLRPWKAIRWSRRRRSTSCSP